MKRVRYLYTKHGQQLLTELLCKVWYFQPNVPRHSVDHSDFLGGFSCCAARYDLSHDMAWIRLRPETGRLYKVHAAVARTGAVGVCDDDSPPKWKTADRCCPFTSRPGADIHKQDRLLDFEVYQIACIETGALIKFCCFTFRVFSETF